MKNIYKSLAIFAIVLLAASCTETITDIEYKSTYARLVVEGSITTDTMAHLVKLTRTGDVLNKDPRVYISNANVSITDGANIFALTEDASNKGYYYTNSKVCGTIGLTYTLNISNVDVDGDGTMETYKASSTIYPANPADSFHVVNNSLNPNEPERLIKMYTRDIGNGRKYYLLKMLKNDTLLTDSTFKYVSYNNLGAEGEYWSGINAYTLNENVAAEKLRIGDRLSMQIMGIDKGYSEFIDAFIQEYYPKTPLFSGPSSNIPTNVTPSDKACGYFSACSVVRTTQIYKGLTKE